MTDDFLDTEAVAALGLADVGPGARISRHAVFLGGERIHLGAHVRIDAFCVLAAGEGGIRVGNHVHLSAHVTVLGRAATVIEDFCTVSVRCSIFTSNDDYSGRTLTNPTVPAHLRAVHSSPVRLGRHSILGAGAVILPGVTVGSSAAVGALSLVRDDVPELAIVAGAPARRIGTRDRLHLDLAGDVPGAPPAAG